MQNSALSDPELLAMWLGQQHESAFHTLVARYAGLVYATAKRACDNDSMAAEVSQLTFITLAQKASSLTSCASLGGWLHTTTLMQTKNLIRKFQRENRKRSLFQAAMENEATSQYNESWHRIQPMLDTALTALTAKDRDALLLRFYRSLSIREIGITLGITTDAAQKRIDRATERLRVKLNHRGYEINCSFSGVMLAGYAAEAQAASLPISLLASKAIATTTLSTSSLSTLLSTALILMKPTTFIPPALVLVATTTWISYQHNSLSTVTQQNAKMQQCLVDHATSATSPLIASSLKTSEESEKLPDDITMDGQLLIRRIAEMLVANGNNTNFSNKGITNPVWELIQHHRGALSKEGLTLALDEIGMHNFPDKFRLDMERDFMFSLSRKDPSFTLNHYESWVNSDHNCNQFFTYAIEQWAKQDPQQASIWLDKQYVSIKTLDPKSQNMCALEGGLITALLSQNPSAAAARMQNLPEAHRELTMCEAMRNIDESGLKPLVVANFIRENLPPQEQMEALFWNVYPYGPDAEITAYLKSIEATPDERASCVANVLSRKIEDLSERKKITDNDLQSMRAWSNIQSPETTDKATGSALAAAVIENKNLAFNEAVQLVSQYDQASGHEETMFSFLSSFDETDTHFSSEILSLAAKLSDSEKRKEILNLLEVKP